MLLTIKVDEQIEQLLGEWVLKVDERPMNEWLTLGMVVCNIVAEAWYDEHLAYCRDPNCRFTIGDEEE